MYANNPHCKNCNYYKLGDKSGKATREKYLQNEKRETLRVKHYAGYYMV